MRQIRTKHEPECWGQGTSTHGPDCLMFNALVSMSDRLKRVYAGDGFISVCQKMRRLILQHEAIQ
jgi:hypothetical protein